MSHGYGSHFLFHAQLLAGNCGNTLVNNKLTTDFFKISEKSTFEHQNPRNVLIFIFLFNEHTWTRHWSKLKVFSHSHFSVGK